MKVSRVLLCLLIVSLLAGGFAYPAQGQGLTTVRMALLPLQSWAPVFIAMDEGYFARFGIKVEFVVFSTGAEAIPALVEGKLDIGAGNLSAAFFNALARGIPVRVTADKGRSGRGDRTNAIMVRKDLADSGQIKSVADLRGKIERLGNVNVDAIAEQDDLEKRNEFLSSQVEDLNKSKTQLQQLISHLNKKSRERFKETFEEIRINFQQVFRKLFGGGKACRNCRSA